MYMYIFCQYAFYPYLAAKFLIVLRLPPVLVTLNNLTARRNKPSSNKHPGKERGRG
jgi:hypothetical protein